RAQRQRLHALDVASIAADIGSIDAQRGVHAFVAYFQRQRDLMPVPAAAVALGNGHGGAVERQIVFPRTVLLRDQLHPHLIFLDRAGVHHPDHQATRLLLVALQSDDVAHFQLIFHAGDERAIGTDVVGASLLRKGAALGAHSPYAYRQIHRQTRFGLVRSHAFSLYSLLVFAPAMIPPLRRAGIS